MCSSDLFSPKINKELRKDEIKSASIDTGDKKISTTTAKSSESSSSNESSSSSGSTSKGSASSNGSTKAERKSGGYTYDPRTRKWNKK